MQETTTTPHSAAALPPWDLHSAATTEPQQERSMPAPPKPAAIPSTVRPGRALPINTRNKYGFTGQGRIHTVAIDGVEWILAPDVVKALGFRQATTYYTSRLPQEQRRLLNRLDCPAVFEHLYGTACCTVVTLEGMLAIGQCLANVGTDPEKFRRWAAKHFKALPRV